MLSVLKRQVNTPKNRNLSIYLFIYFFFVELFIS